MNPYNPNELYHHGIGGMKWGKRNGPPYPLSRSDYSAAEKRALGSKRQKIREKNIQAKEIEKQDRNQNGSNSIDLNAAKQLSDETIKATKGIAKIADKAARKKYSSKIDTSHLTDQEMQAYIRRANLEKQYTSLKVEEYAAGRRQASEILDTVGDVLTTTGSILGAIILAKALAEKTGK